MKKFLILAVFFLEGCSFATKDICFDPFTFNEILKLKEEIKKLNIEEQEDSEKDNEIVYAEFVQIPKEISEKGIRFCVDPETMSELEKIREELREIKKDIRNQCKKDKIENQEK